MYEEWSTFGTSTESLMMGAILTISVYGVTQDCELSLDNKAE